MRVSAGRARLEVEDMETEDYHDLVNALLDGPSEEARASFEVEWRRKIRTQELTVGTVDQQFRGTFTQTNARVKWSARKKGFEFDRTRTDRSCAGLKSPRSATGLLLLIEGRVGVDSGRGPIASQSRQSLDENRSKSHSQLAAENLFLRKQHVLYVELRFFLAYRQEARVKSLNMWITLAMACPSPALAQTPALAAPAAVVARGPQTNWWSQAGGENGPERTVWAAQKTPETPYTGVNKPIWHIADILKSHQSHALEEKVVRRDFDGRYVQMAPGDKAKCLFYDDRVFGWVYSGAVKMTIDGQEPKVLSKGWAFNVAPRLSCHGDGRLEPVVYYRNTPAGQVPSYPESETPTPIPGYKYVKTKITSTGGYDSFNVPFFNVTEYGDSTRTGERFL